MAALSYHVDFETRSALDLRVVGAYVYAMHPSTNAWCMSYALGDGPKKIWVQGQPFPAELAEHIKAGGLMTAHNAQFERIIWKYIMAPRYGWPEPDVRQWRCTMAMAYAMALPGALDDAAAATGMEIKKDAEGRRIMLKMSKPRSKRLCSECEGSGHDKNFETCDYCFGTGALYTWWDSQMLKERLYAYCIQDIEVERLLEKRLLPLRPQEQEIWFMDQEINDRGVFVDQVLCNKALRIVEETQKTLNREIKRLTEGFVDTCASVSELVKWLNKQFGEPKVTTVDKEAIKEMLGAWELPGNTRRALEIRQEYAKTSTAKIKKMLEMQAADGRMRGNLQYHGAGPGRWAARGAQLQNLPRPKIEDTWGAIESILDGMSPMMIGITYGPPLSVVSDCIRGMIAAPTGKEITAGDFSNIEGRGVAWLAGQVDKLEAFRAFDNKTGPDLYLVAAAAIFGVPIEDAKPFRQIGKVAELSLGYQGGPAAFGAMAGGYGLKIGDQFDIVMAAARLDHKQEAQDAWDSRGKGSGMDKNSWLAGEVIKLGWRAAHPKIVQFWYDLERAAIDAVANPGRVYTVRNIAYRMNGSFLWCRLPCGRAICYPYPRLKVVKVPWGEKEAIVYKGVDGRTRKWQDQTFYGGLACENITQAVARDVMAEAMLRVDKVGYKVILTVHDEVVSEHDKGFGSLEEFLQIMQVNPVWAAGFPIAASGWRGPRYRK